MDATYHQPNTSGIAHMQNLMHQYQAESANQATLNASSQSNSTGHQASSTPASANPNGPVTTESAPAPAAPEERYVLKLSSKENEIYFTTGELYSLLATKAKREKVSIEGIEVQTIGGGRGPFMIVTPPALGVILLDDEQIELVKIDPANEAINRALFEVMRLDAQGRAFDDGTEKRIKDLRRARQLDKNKDECDRTYRFFIDGNTEMLIMKNANPEKHKALFKEVMDFIKARVPSHERDNFTDMLDDVGHEQNVIILFIVRSADMTEAEFLRRIKWHELKYAVIRKDMNPCKIRIMRELALKVGIKACCFLNECMAFGKFPCGGRSRAMANVRLPSNFGRERIRSA